MHDETDDRKERMQRVRVGLTGLAVVLLLVLLATVVLTRINGKAGPVSNSAANQTDNEPLSDLGIVPRAPDNGAVPPAAAVPVGAKP